VTARHRPSRRNLLGNYIYKCMGKIVSAILVNRPNIVVFFLFSFSFLRQNLNVGKHTAPGAPNFPNLKIEVAGLGPPLKIEVAGLGPPRARLLPEVPGP
jgi:hypothetical protein